MDFELVPVVFVDDVPDVVSVQVLEQESVLILLPSSHFSVPSFLPLPHDAADEDLELLLEEDLELLLEEDFEEDFELLLEEDFEEDFELLLEEDFEEDFELLLEEEDRLELDVAHCVASGAHVTTSSRHTVPMPVKSSSDSHVESKSQPSNAPHSDSVQSGKQVLQSLPVAVQTPEEDSDAEVDLLVDADSEVEADLPVEAELEVDLLVDADFDVLFDVDADALDPVLLWLVWLV